MAGLDEKLATLEKLSSAELREEWRRAIATPLPRISPSLLRLAPGMGDTTPDVDNPMNDD